MCNGLSIAGHQAIAILICTDIKNILHNAQLHRAGINFTNEPIIQICDSSIKYNDKDTWYFCATYTYPKSKQFCICHDSRIVVPCTKLLPNCNQNIKADTFSGGSNHQLMNRLRNGSIMMTSSNGNFFRVTGPLCGEFTGPGEFPAQRPVTRSFDVFFDLRLNKRLSKQSWGWRFKTSSCSLWRHRHDIPETQLSNYLCRRKKILSQR